MNTTRSIALRALSLAVSLALVAPDPALACGGYGSFQLEPEHADAAVATAQNAIARRALRCERARA